MKIQKLHFTLIEIIIAMTIFALLMPALTMTFNSGIKAYRKSYANSTLIQDVRGLFLSLKNDLQYMVPVDCASNIYENKKISFVIQDRKWANQNRITYNFKDNEVNRESEPLSQEDEQVLNVKLIDNIEIVVIEYFVDDSWMVKPPPKISPKAIRIYIKATQDNAEKTFSTVLNFVHLNEVEKKK